MDGSGRQGATPRLSRFEPAAPSGPFVAPPRGPALPAYPKTGRKWGRGGDQGTMGVERAGRQAENQARAQSPRPSHAKPTNRGLCGTPGRAPHFSAPFLDAKASMDGLTDEAHGHPHYLALEPRDRALVPRHIADPRCAIAAISTTRSRALRKKPLPAGATAPARHPACRFRADPCFLDVPGSQRRRPRGRLGAGGSPFAGASPVWSMRFAAARPRARRRHLLTRLRDRARARAPNGFADRLARDLWPGEGGRPSIACSSAGSADRP
jgi:hypothetical protein